jgi:hypothetical protein
MPALTEAQQLDFVRRVAAVLKESKAEIEAEGFPATQRATELDGLAADADKAEAEQAQAQAIAAQKTRDAVTKREKAYARASASVEGVVGALGKDHTLVKKLKGLRDSMTLEAARGKKTKTPS